MVSWHGGWHGAWHGAHGNPFVCILETIHRILWEYMSCGVAISDDVGVLVTHSVILFDSLWIMMDIT